MSGMMDDQTVRRAYRLFAYILEYPSSDLRGRVEECAELLSTVNHQAEHRLRKFQSLVQDTTSSRLEEVYTGTFDLQVVCYPYVGYQLFGESYKRGAFMVGLKEQYRQCGFSEGKELPDHLAVLLRFLAILDDAEASQEISTMCLMPSLDKMALAFKDKDQPYGEVVLALLDFLNGIYPGVGESAVTRTVAEPWHSAPMGCQLGQGVDHDAR